MFTKLLKYEWKANVGLLSLLCGCAVGLGCVAAVILRILTANWDAILESDTAVLFLAPSIIFLFAAFLGIMMLYPCIKYILLYRFYKSRFTDEGYLMFTLPVKTSHLFLSSAIHFMIWDVIYIVVLIVSLVIAVGFGPVWPDEITREIVTSSIEIPSGFRETLGSGYTLTGLLSLLIMWIYEFVAPMSAVVLGASIAKKHKVLAIIGILIGLSTVTGTASGIISGILQLIAYTVDNVQLIATLTPLLSSIVPLGFIIGGYLLSIHIMKRKLNLP